VRLLLDTDSRALVGHLVVYPRRWWPWRRGRQFAAYEAPDASLVFCGRIVGWPVGMTTVQDADGHLVALVRGNYILSPGGALLAYYQPEPASRRSLFLGPDGLEIARWEVEGTGTALHFGPAVQEEPFTKMGLLAAVLTVPGSKPG
jgi:hypothetical protein